MTELLQGRYDVDFKSGLIGEGAFQKAYKVYDHYLDKHSILLIEKDYNNYEANTIKELSNYRDILNHPNILFFNNIIKFRIDDVVLDGVIVDYSEIGSLENLKSYETNENDIQNIFVDVLSALSHIHQNGVVHRDIKPDNILIFRDSNNKYTAKISDWSAAIFNNSIKKSPIVGTLAFMDPEILKSGTTSSSSDIWSFGALVYNFFTGKILHSSRIDEYFKTANKEFKLDIEGIPSPYDLIIQKSLSLSPQNRPDAMELIDMLKNSINKEKFRHVFPKTSLANFRTVLFSRAGLPVISDVKAVDIWLENYSRDKVKILFLAANPTTSPLSLDREIKKISASIKMSKQRDRFVLHSAHAVSPETLLQEILDFEPNIVHFSGHGNLDGIVLESSLETELLVTDKALIRLFRLFKDKVDCVVLNSCYSLQQAKAINTVIPYVIGMKKSIPDLTAISFSSGFYKGLGSGKNILFSYELGLANIELEGYSGVDIPELMNEYNA